jgi:hypothetical protein
MYPRTNYEMTEDDLKAILDASRSVPAMFGSGGTPLFGTPQENANAAWRRLGEKMGFDYATVRPIGGKGQRFFSAVPNETETQRAERLTREASERRQAEIATLTAEIEEWQRRLEALRG